MAIVIIFRKREVFKASSFRSTFDCVMIPVTFHIGLALILANLIAKNYRIYRIFNNVFVTKTVVTDWQLLKFSGGILIIVVTLLISWLGTSQIIPIKVPVSREAYYSKCSFQGSSSSIFTTLLTIVPAAQLAFATFLAIKTRTVGKSYSKYSEYKQIGISVYYSGKRSDISGRMRENPSSGNNNRSSSGGVDGDTETKNRELMSINRLLANPNAIDPALVMAQHQNTNVSSTSSDIISNVTKAGNNINGSTTIFEAHEARMPVQVVLRYFPFLSAWDMKHVFLFPRVRYFSFFSEKSQKGRVFGYNRATIESSQSDAYILRVHGSSVTDVLIQVASHQELENWLGWFNSSNNGFSSSSAAATTSAGSSTLTCLTSPTNSVTKYIIPSIADNYNGNKNKKYDNIKNNDSGITARQHLLPDRQESNITLETLDSGVSGPLVTELNYSQMMLPSALPITLSETQQQQQQTSATRSSRWSMAPTVAENFELEDIPVKNVRR
ncbi:hypothetical protein BDB00DRAFT_936177 [Zychaea mexicana]|uniref:uncharacterized protein n=1 Tax=Zychaea mexicana TaxID=64656 RepID=UPI0022FE28FF|nr:uncharacterized protein BDB00DRAFT_936177 [Zychaea mexicana]KAI9497751.1 hypothetical protein BDB00DRAFT_936177 [Zychaea mexicana]